MKIRMEPVVRFFGKVILKIKKAYQGVAAPVASLLGQLLSRVFVVLLRKIIPQSRNLKAAAELNVMWARK